MDTTEVIMGYIIGSVLFILSIITLILVLIHPELPMLNQIIVLIGSTFFFYLSLLFYHISIGGLYYKRKN